MKKRIIIFAVLVLMLVGLSAAPASACFPPCPGTGTPGYWKNHPEAWPVEEITIGSITYAKGDAIEIMNNPVRRDKFFTMFDALVAAKLNVILNRNVCKDESWCIRPTISEATEWMKDIAGLRPVKASSKAWKIGEPLYLMLDKYNNGKLCLPSRDALE